ncbi:GNAT family N-acetyltransferase [Pontibacter harenae]|uniref:GNAT family N-acetyltransferase n=1 Tax=Pontibacter harenae TaxID=2894083 RepID=UPI001E5AD9A2|nr:GNAT family N-acetyltransferase [Pontibacter harenae]MCC9166949.1 N-acetyltransferase [Pontibacter harenae]
MNVIHDEDDLRFYGEVEGDEAELTYTYPDDKVMDFDHTFVPIQARGKGLADQLVKAGLDFAKDKGYQIIPSCPVVAAYVKRHPEYGDLVDNG